MLLKKSQAAWDERDGLRMLTLTQAVQDGPWELPACVRAEAAQQEARVHAMVTGDTGVVQRKLDQARHLLAEDVAASRDGSRELAGHYDRSLLAMQTAICYREAGRPEEAVSIYQETLSPSVFSVRDYGYFLALMADALPQRLEQAAVRAVPARVSYSPAGGAVTMPPISLYGLSVPIGPAP